MKPFLDFIIKPINWAREQIKRLYAWTAKWAQHKNAEKALAGVSFAESSFFPVPPDPLLLAMVFTKTEKWKRYAFITTTASVLGGIFGYAVGALLFDIVGDWILDTYHLREGFDDLAMRYNDNATVAVFTAALTPIPYKIVTLSAGAFHINFVAFLIASIIGRGVRFTAVSALAHFLGKKYKDVIEKYIDIISFGIVALIIMVLIILN